MAFYLKKLAGVKTGTRVSRSPKHLTVPKSFYETQMTRRSRTLLRGTVPAPDSRELNLRASSPLDRNTRDTKSHPMPIAGLQNIRFTKKAYVTNIWENRRLDQGPPQSNFH